MNSVVPSWTGVESKSALSSAIADQIVAGKMVTADPNAWGFFKLPSGKVLVVGYADLGLLPVAVLFHNRLLVGVDEVLESFDADTLEKQFSYRMPAVFHEFVSLADPIIVRDEIGFVGISADGKECWCSLTSGPIKKFAIEHGRIHGETIDDEPFAFAIPS
jgi:hypothetical protein